MTTTPTLTGRRAADEVTGFNTADPHRPAVVVAATGPDDVVAAVRHAAAHDLPLTVHATGHGHRTGVEGGVVVATGAMRGLHVDPERRTARVEAGVRSAELVAAAAEHGLAPVSGSFPGVGVVGYTLGGGLGLLGRRFGWASDHLRAAEVVTPDGVLRRVSATAADEDERALFASLRGGREPAGVVTAVEIGLVELDEVVGGGLFLDVTDAPAVLPVVRALAADGPGEGSGATGYGHDLAVSLGVVPVPDIPAVPAPIRGRTVLHVRLADAAPGGPHARAAEAAIRGAGTVLLGEVTTMPWTASGEIFGEPEFPHAYEGTNAMVAELDDDDLAAIVDAARTAAVPCVVDVRRLGGALARPSTGPDAVSFRAARWIVRVLSASDGADPTTLRAAHGAVLAPVADRTLGRMPGFVYGAAPVADDDLREPRVRALLDRVRAAFPARRPVREEP